MYWISVLIFLRLAHVRQVVKNKVFDSRLNALSTLPPKDIILLVSTLIRKASKEVEIALDLLNKYEKADDEQKIRIISGAEETVRTVLDNIIDIAQLWDDPLKIRNDIVYRSNVMIVLGIQGVKEQYFDLAKIFSVVKTYNGAKDEFTGLIVLADNKLTTTTKSGESKPDDDIKPIAFPFTDLDEIKNNNKRSQNLLGAPYSVVNNKPCFIINTNEIVNGLSEEIGFDEDTKNRILTYYSEHTEANSICSFPLSALDASTVIGVINIYRNQEGMLKNGERMEDYYNLITPFLIELSRILPKLFEVKS